MTKRKRKIGIIVGSENDLPQCYEGFRYLIDRTAAGKVEVAFVHVTSLHRHHKKLLKDLEKFSELPEGKKLDALIIGAGWADHLTGTCDAFLRNELRDNKIVVYGVAFEDPANPKHTRAAILSITEVPNHQVVFRYYVGSKGFLNACNDAINDELRHIELPEPKPCLKLTLEQALKKSCKLQGHPKDKKRREKNGTRRSSFRNEHCGIRAF